MIDIRTIGPIAHAQRRDLLAALVSTSKFSHVENSAYVLDLIKNRRVRVFLKTPCGPLDSDYTEVEIDKDDVKNVRPNPIVARTLILAAEYFGENSMVTVTGRMEHGLLTMNSVAVDPLYGVPPQESDVRSWTVALACLTWYLIGVSLINRTAWEAANHRATTDSDPKERHNAELASQRLNSTMHNVRASLKVLIGLMSHAPSLKITNYYYMPWLREVSHPDTTARLVFDVMTIGELGDSTSRTFTYNVANEISKWLASVCGVLTPYTSMLSLTDDVATGKREDYFRALDELRQWHDDNFANVKWRHHFDSDVNSNS